MTEKISSTELRGLLEQKYGVPPEKTAEQYLLELIAEELHHILELDDQQPEAERMSAAERDACTAMKNIATNPDQDNASKIAEDAAAVILHAYLTTQDDHPDWIAAQEAPEPQETPLPDSVSHALTDTKDALPNLPEANDTDNDAWKRCIDGIDLDDLEAAAAALQALFDTLDKDKVDTKILFMLNGLLSLLETFIKLKKAYDILPQDDVNRPIFEIQLIKRLRLISHTLIELQ